MASVSQAVSSLTDRYQTTVPEPVRKALNLGKRDKIRYTIRADGEVLLSRQTGPDEADPVLARFIAFLAADIAAHPERLQAVDAHLVQHLRKLVAGIEVDLDAPLSAEDE